MKKLIFIPLLLVAAWAHAQVWTENGSYIYPTNGAANIGIGTTTPGAPLHISATAPYQLVVEEGSITGADGGIKIVGKRNNCNSCEPAFIDLANYDHDITTEYAMARISANTDGGDLLNGNLRLYTSNAGTLVERMRITSAGNFGLGGATNPQARIHVQGQTAQLALFENTATSAADAGVTILGKRNQCVNCDIAYLDLNDVDYDEPGATEFTMARVSGGMQTTAGKNGYLRFYTSKLGTLNEQMRITADGDVYIGTENTAQRDFRLFVEDGILTEKIVVEVAGNFPWPDYVFAPEYNLRPISEVASFIQENSHLPEVPSAKQVAEEGVNLAEMNATLLQKVEELTLYIIDLQYQVNDLKQQVNK